jgi:hypothetical protein
VFDCRFNRLVWLLVFGEGLGLKCPICSKKLDFDGKLKSAVCHSCGWRKVIARAV